MDLAILRKIALELHDRISGAFINKIHQPLPREIVLRLRIPSGGEEKLFISADPQLGRLHLTKLRIPNPPSPPRFCAYLRAHLQGSRVTAVHAAPDDRVVTIRTTRGPEGNRVGRNLILELLGRDSNILLVDASSNLIMDCLHRIPEKETGSRTVQPGWEYHPPPRAGGRGDASPDESELMTARPGIGTGVGGKQRLLFNVVSPEDEHYPTMNEAADAFYGRRLGSALLEALRRETAAPLRSRIRSLARRIEKIRADEKRLKQFTDRREDGELLKANLHLVTTGMESVEVTDWATGLKRVIRLDPALGGISNMKRIFAKAAKGRRGEEFVRRRMEETLAEKGALEDALYSLEDAANASELEMAAPEVAPKPEPGKTKPRPDAGRRAPEESSMLRKFRTPSGGVALVGRSGRGNDFILRRKAGKDDLWLHVKGYAGAHVLLPRRGMKELPAEDMEFAAGLAVYHSKAKGGGKAEVMVAEVKDLNRPKGAFPGQVTVKKYTTVIAGSPDGPLVSETS